MNDYKTVLFLIALLSICFVIYLLLRLSILLYRKNRLKDFGIDNSNNDINITLRYKYLFKISNFIEKLIIFNGIARVYDKYIYEDSKLRKGLDYITLKILCGLAMIIVYTFVIALTKDDFNSLMPFICFILGYIIPDFYCYFSYIKLDNISFKDILNAVIIMHNSYKVKTSTEQVLLELISRTEGTLQREFKKVLGDIKLGLGIGEAFYRMYERTGLKVILQISNILSLVNKSNASIIDSFELIEKNLINEEKFITEIEVQKSINKLSYVIFLFLPLIFIIFVILNNENYLNLLLEPQGFVILIILFILYFLYFFIINKIEKGRYL